MKEKLESYLESAYAEIEERRASGKIKWQEEADKIKTLLNIDINSEALRKKFRKLRITPPTTELEFSYKETRRINGDVTIEDNVEKKLSDDELYTRYNRPKTDWTISTLWFKDTVKGMRISVCFSPIKKGQVNINYFQDEFKKFLSTIPKAVPFPSIKESKVPQEYGCLIIPKQDAHFNKLDIHGKNCIETRFDNLFNAIQQTVKEVTTSNKLESIVYIVGSDEFNSEWTGLTTKGTPQQNILSYQEAFKKICDYEIKVINYLASKSLNVSIVFIPGNHDEFVGWHLIHFLEAHYKDCHNIKIDSGLDNTKVIKYNNTAILLNHGDAMRPKELASKFPILAKDIWSSCDNYYIFTGDKHHELSHDFDGIYFYQVPQLSKAQSKWDNKRCYGIAKPELVSFLINETNGMKDIKKLPI